MRSAGSLALALWLSGCSAAGAPSATEPSPSGAASAAPARPEAEPQPPAPPPTAPVAPSAAAPSPDPLGGPAEVELPVPGHGAAVVAVPVGARTPRPLVLATHGNYDRPEWQCAVWREITGGEAFVLCPRGVPRPDSPSRDDVRFTYPTNAALEAEIEAALEPLRARFGEHVRPGPIVYAGFSLGAIMGVAIAARARHPGRFTRLVLVEGGHDRWTAATARAFRQAGGERVLFACGQASCFVDARRAAQHLERSSVATRVVGVRDAGHDYGGRVAAAVREAWAWVVEPTGPADLGPAPADVPAADGATAEPTRGGPLDPSD